VVFCHSCGFSGNAISFYSEVEGLPFYQTVEKLAERFSINLDDNKQYQEQKSIVKHNTVLMNKFYKQQSVISEFLIKKRGLTQEILDEFMIGYSDDPKFLKGKNPLTEFTGIVIPIHDIYGRVVGFSKRRIDGNTKPTYVNSYETEVFNKSGTLFNLNRARKMLKDTKRLYVVEGYMDAISGHIQGLACVGYIGGYLVKGQIQLLKDITKLMPQVELVFAPDNPKIDETGAKEMVRIREKLMKYAPELIAKSRFINYNSDEHKDFNNLLMAGIDIGKLETQGIDKTVLELQLNNVVISKLNTRLSQSLSAQ
jgi:DNA primase